MEPKMVAKGQTQSEGIGSVTQLKIGMDRVCRFREKKKESHYSSGLYLLLMCFYDHIFDAL